MWPFSRTPKPLSIHGYDLSKWNYLGLSKISWSNREGVTTSWIEIAFFLKKDDDLVRSYEFLGDDFSASRFKYHSWITQVAETWRIGESEYYQPVNRVPSSYLKERMKEEFECVWSDKTHWWVSDDQVKYEIAVEEQKETPILAAKENVVTVDFTKK